MSVRYLVAALVIALLTACTGPGDSTPEATAPPTSAPAADSTTVPASTTTTTPPDPAYAEAIDLDPEVRFGVLDNGLTYFVRENDAPGQRLQLRLAVNAGSVLEDEDQAGAAHFLEHMLFNGTERWPKNDLISVLESFGAQFGPDINAYTAFDETVYELETPADSERVELAFDVLREWATRALIDEAEVVAERGVVVEEWRLRDQGINGRVANLIDGLLLVGTDYEDMSPIGNFDAIDTMEAPELRRFYEDWYRPDLMAVIAVGDLPAERLEEEIVERFSDLGAPSTPRNRTSPEVPRPQDRTAVSGTRSHLRLRGTSLPSA